MGTALTLLHFYLKRVAFTEIDRFLLGTACVYLACKIDYRHLSLEKVAEFYFQQRSGGKKSRKPLQEIIDSLFQEYCRLEISILTSIEFDLEFDLPIKHVRRFKTRYFKLLQMKLKSCTEKQMESLGRQVEKLCDLAGKVVRDQYIRPFCLYFHAIVIAAACLLIADTNSCYLEA
jgi:hypothetical protein